MESTVTGGRWGELSPWCRVTAAGKKLFLNLLVRERETCSASQKEEGKRSVVPVKAGIKAIKLIREGGVAGWGWWCWWV